MNGAPDASPLQDFAIEIDTLISYDSVHYQDYDVNRAPIHRAFRAQAGNSAVRPNAVRRTPHLSKQTHAFMTRM